MIWDFIIWYDLNIIDWYDTSSFTVHHEVEIGDLPGSVIPGITWQYNRCPFFVAALCNTPLHTNRLYYRVSLHLETTDIYNRPIGASLHRSTLTLRRRGSPRPTWRPTSCPTGMIPTIFHHYAFNNMPHFGCSCVPPALRLCVCMLSPSGDSWSGVQHEVCRLGDGGGDHELPQLLLRQRVSFIYFIPLSFFCFAAIWPCGLMRGTRCPPVEILLSSLRLWCMLIRIVCSFALGPVASSGILT